jgi:hypothetical protein
VKRAARRPFPLVAVLGVLLGSPLVASRAQADDRAIAQQAFQEGRELMAAGKVAQACPKFAAAAQLSQTAGVRLNLAECYAKLGKTASAWAKADEALAIADRAGDAAAAGVARDQMAALKPKLSYLTLAVDRDTAPPGFEVRLDGEKLPDAVWGTAFPVDPGEHQATATAPGRQPWSSRTTVTGAGVQASVTVPSLAVQASAPRAESSQEHGASGGGWSRGTVHALALASGGLGLVGLGVGAWFGLQASSQKSQYEQHKVNGACVDEQCVTISKDAVSSATVSTVGFVAGGVLAAAGLALWVTAPERGAEGHAVAVVPVAGPQGVGAGISGSW